ncbi:MAG: hypothetical protein EZS28_032053 [Streblomastix strix]|uniref:Uncharacterized protein n=1 Tax=Streblomastix strix TaxID=222440 RepID=A0A5J4UQX1_9EUKA|nr:MAG: hypothetical protein EZS28_032053 [Streblomastix strix]
MIPLSQSNTITQSLEKSLLTYIALLQSYTKKVYAICNSALCLNSSLRRNDAQTESVNFRTTQLYANDSSYRYINHLSKQDIVLQRLTKDLFSCVFDLRGYVAISNSGCDERSYAHTYLAQSFIQGIAKLSRALSAYFLVREEELLLRDRYFSEDQIIVLD